jgi:rhamnogalacturonyl hydrolase YesR
MDMTVLNSFNSLKRYCVKENFQGWDPYDGLMSRIFKATPVLPKSRLARLMWIQFIKKMPLNLRGPLRIEKGSNAKGLALFISGFSQLSRIDKQREESIMHIKELADRVIQLNAPGYSGICWGYNFDWESRAFYQKKNTPTIVATSYVANALIDAFEVTSDEKYLNNAISAKDFILKDLKRTYNHQGDFAFSYSPFDNTSVFNASLLGARLLSRIYSYNKEEELLALARKAVSYCCHYQNPDGSWFYSSLPFHQWIDNFHTGFNLECIYEYGSFSKDESFKENFTKGLEYYVNTFFDNKGRSKYYQNALYPIDIHAPSQLIITLSKSHLIEERQELVDRVTKWTIQNMQSSKGYFYFQKRKLYTNKIPYMRWSQGWMFYGLSHYLSNSYAKSKV